MATNPSLSGLKIPTKKFPVDWGSGRGDFGHPSFGVIIRGGIDLEVHVRPVGDIPPIMGYLFRAPHFSLTRWGMTTKKIRGVLGSRSDVHTEKKC